MKLQSSGWCGSKRRSSRRLDRLERARDPGARGQRAGPLDRDEGDRVIGVERVAIGVRDDTSRGELADPVDDRARAPRVDLERIVAEVEAPELGAERGRGRAPPRRGGSLDALDRLPRLLPELSRLAALAVGEREHVALPPRSCRQRQRAARPPDEVGRVGADRQQAAGSRARSPCRRGGACWRPPSSAPRPR